MNSEELIESGTLELYVFGLLPEDENSKIQEMAQANPAVQEEILAIEKAVINLSYSASPHLSAANYNRIKKKLIEKHNGVVQMEKRSGTSGYIGWAAAVILMFGIGFQYYKYNQAAQQAETVKAERNKFEQMLATLQKQNSETEKALAIVRGQDNITVALEGQQASPESYAKVYINNAKNEIYVDIAGLPKAPEGKVYQVWALKLNPITPTSIGVLDDDSTESNGIYKVDNFEGAEAFGITLEPAGGSASPTLEQLYTLGKV